MDSPDSRSSQSDGDLLPSDTVRAFALLWTLGTLV